MSLLYINLMRNQNEVDDPETAGAFKTIVRALDRQSRTRERRPGLAISMVAVLGAVLGSVLWYSYPREKAQHELMVTPIVRADAGSYRVVPRDPGGMDIPYQDSTVFDVLAGAQGATAQPVENLLPPAEKPLSREQIFAGQAPGDKGTPQVVATAQPPQQPLQQPAYMKALTDEDDVPVKAAQALSRTEPASGVETFEKKNSAGTTYIQLGSMRSHEAAESAWKKMQMDFPAQLRDVTPRIQRADLGSRGVFYRLQGGPVSATKAQSICQTIGAEKPGGCLVVRN